MDTIWRNWSWIVATLATVNSLPSRFGLEKPSQTCLVTCILAPFCLVDIFDQALPLPFSICASLLLGSFTKSALLDPSFGFKNQTEGILVKVCPRGTHYLTSRSDAISTENPRTRSTTVLCDDPSITNDLWKSEVQKDRKLHWLYAGCLTSWMLWDSHHFNHFP